jgi:hypothetical protein
VSHAPAAVEQEAEIGSGVVEQMLGVIAMSDLERHSLRVGPVLDGEGKERDGAEADGLLVERVDTLGIVPTAAPVVRRRWAPYVSRCVGSTTSKRGCAG